MHQMPKGSQLYCDKLQSVSKGKKLILRQQREWVDIMIELGWSNRCALIELLTCLRLIHFFCLELFLFVGGFPFNELLWSGSAVLFLAPSIRHFPYIAAFIPRLFLESVAYKGRVASFSSLFSLSRLSWYCSQRLKIQVAFQLYHTFLSKYLSLTVE